MEPPGPDGIIPGASRDGLTDQPAPRQAILPDPDAAPCPRPALALSHCRHLRVLVLVTGGHFLTSTLFYLLIVYQICGPSMGRLAHQLAPVLFLPANLLDRVEALPDTHLAVLLLNSLLWAPTVYGLFLSGRWAWHRTMRQPPPG